MKDDRYVLLCGKIAQRIRRTLDYCCDIPREAFMGNTLLQ